MIEEVQRILYELRRLYLKMIEEGFDPNELEIEKELAEIKKELGHWYMENPMMFRAA